MTTARGKIEIGIDKIVLTFTLLAQICAVVWAVAMLHSSTEHNKENLEKISTMLTSTFTSISSEMSDIKVRLRAAEKEVSIISSILELEFKREGKK